jgi:ABC-type branched-subunit amino acid transport system ATPase component
MRGETNDLLVVDHLTVAYNRGAPALHGISFAIPQGSITGLIGTNGAGKTTTLHAIAGLMRGDAARIMGGGIRFKGRDIQRQPPHLVAHLGIALVPEQRKIFGSLTVADNLRASGTGRGRRLVDTDTLYALFPTLGRRSKIAAGHLSGGERQILAIAMGLLGNPDLLMIDEMTLGLSPAMCVQLAGVVRDLRDRFGLTILIVEQNAAVALDLVDCVHVIEHGSIVRSGDAQALKTDRRFRDVYLGIDPSDAAARYGPGSKPQRPAPVEPAMLTVRDLSIRYGGVTAIDGVSIDVRRGDFLGIIGPNGAGKTSLLNAITGLAPVHAGAVMFEERDITRMPLRQRVHQGIARTYQGAELFPSLTVVENLMIGRHHLMRSGPVSNAAFVGGTLTEEISHRRRTEEIIELLQLESMRHAPAGVLPFAIQKIVGLGRALCTEPRLLLLDEIASGLTHEEKLVLARHLLRINQDLGITIMWVEHDVRMVRDLATRVVALHYGRHVADGPPNEVLASAAVQQSFFGATPVGPTRGESG